MKLFIKNEDINDLVSLFNTSLGITKIFKKIEKRFQDFSAGIEILYNLYVVQ